MILFIIRLLCLVHLEHDSTSGGRVCNRKASNHHARSQQKQHHTTAIRQSMLIWSPPIALYHIVSPNETPVFFPPDTSRQSSWDPRWPQRPPWRLSHHRPGAPGPRINGPRMGPRFQHSRSMWIKSQSHEFSSCKSEDQKPTIIPPSHHRSHHFFCWLGMYLTSETSQHIVHGYRRPLLPTVFSLKSALITLEIDALPMNNSPTP